MNEASYVTRSQRIRIDAKELVGKTIKKIDLVEVEGLDGEKELAVERIRFSDGSRLMFIAWESEDEPYVQFVLNRAHNTRKDQNR